MAGFTFKNEGFEGPIDLLLSLIEKRKLHISTVSLSKVADEFIDYVQKLEGIPLEEIADFLNIASTLLLIKSVSLLPKFEVSDEEKVSMEELELRLKIYEMMRERSQDLKEILGKNQMHFANQTKNFDAVFSPSKDLSASNLTSAINTLISLLPKPTVLKEVVVKQIRKIEDVIEDLTERVKRSLKLSFKDFSGMGKEERVNVVVSFLAMLELVKQGVVNANQNNNFDDIHIETTNPSIPTYN